MIKKPSELQIVVEDISVALCVPVLFDIVNTTRLNWWLEYWTIGLSVDHVFVWYEPDTKFSAPTTSL